MKLIPKLIYFLIFISIIFNAINTYTYQNNLEFVTTEQITQWNSKLTFSGYVLISVASILSFFLYRDFFPPYISFCYLALIALVFIASLNDLGPMMKNPSSLYSIKGIGTFVNFGILFFAANTLYFPKILKLFYYLCFVFVVAGIINLGKVGLGAGRDQYLFAIREFTIYLIWVFPYFLLQDESTSKKNFLNVVVFLLIFLFVLSSGSRAYLVIYLVYFVTKFKNQITGKNALLAVVGVVVLTTLGFFILSNSGLNKIIEGAFNILSERKTDDSRSSQIIDFIGQWDFDFLLNGVGPRKTWYWYGVGEYSYLDNQFLLLAWWAGLPTLMVYIFFLIKSFFIKSELLIFEKAKGIKLIIGFWILACMGFAIYISISSDLYYYFISLLIGLYTCRFTKIYTKDIEEV